LDQRVPELDHLTLAWNILFDREAPSDCALGVRPPQSGAQIHFLHPWKGRLLAGTGYAPRNTKEKNPKPSMDEIHNHLEDLNEAVPALQLSPQDILHVFAGYLPAEQDGVQLAKKDLIIDHAKRGGPRGLYSVRSTKLTAARATAEKVLLEIFPNRDLAPPDMEAFSNMRSAKVAQRGVWDYGWYPDGGDDSWLKSLSRIIEEESVCHLDDLLLRRTSLGDNPFRALELAPELCGLFDWDSDRCQEEIERVEHHFRWVEKDASESLKEDGDA
jgi:glycerol-3-phosphate dehydrogenase